MSHKSSGGENLEDVRGSEILSIQQEETLKLKNSNDLQSENPSKDDNANTSCQLEEWAMEDSSINLDKTIETKRNNNIRPPAFISLLDQSPSEIPESEINRIENGTICDSSYSFHGAKPAQEATTYGTTSNLEPFPISQPKSNLPLRDESKTPSPKRPPVSYSIRILYQTESEYYLQEEKSVAYLSDDESVKNDVETNGFEVFGPWSTYDIKPEEDLSNNVHQLSSVDKLIRIDDLEDLAPIERRVIIGGQKFTVVGNETNHMSLYRAISRAISGSESHFNKIHEDIFTEIKSSWMAYFKEMSNENGSINFLEHYNMKNPDEFLNAYKEQYFTSTHLAAPSFHLLAASRIYKFICILIDANSNNEVATVYNFREEPTLTNNPKRIFHFIKTTSHQDAKNWHYEFLIPIGPSQVINDGSYVMSIFDVLLIDQQFEQHEGCSPAESHYKRRNNLLTKQPPLFFSLNHRIYCYKPTNTTDLWSIIAEILFGKLSRAPKIYKLGFYAKIAESKYHHKSLQRKQQLKGSGQESLLKKILQTKSSTPGHKNGSVTDLEHIAHYLGVSCTLVGLNHCGNFFWKEFVNEKSSINNNTKSYPNVVLFVHILKNKDIQWYALEDSGLEFPLKKVFKIPTFVKDENAYRKVHYCRTEPFINFDKPYDQGFTRGALRRIGLEIVRRGLSIVTTMISTSSSRLFSNIAQHASAISENSSNRPPSWFPSFRQSKRVSPAQDDTVLQLYP